MEKNCKTNTKFKLPLLEYEISQSINMYLKFIDKLIIEIKDHKLNVVSGLFFPNLFKFLLILLKN